MLKSCLHTSASGPSGVPTEEELLSPDPSPANGEIAISSGEIIRSKEQLEAIQVSASRRAMLLEELLSPKPKPEALS